MRHFILIFFLLFSGCSSLTREQESNVSKWLIPVNAAVGYFGAIGWHETGHAITAMALGGEDTTVSVLPSEDRDGKWHLGLTTTRFDDPSELEITLFNTMGPIAMFVGHIGARGLLRTGGIPRLAQPTLAWFGILSQIGYYGQTILGLARVKHTDLGKEDAWIAGVMLVGGLAIDLIDFFTDSPERYFGVLLGEGFYDDKEPTRRLSFLVAPTGKGAFLAFRAEW